METNVLIRAWKYAGDLEEFFRLVGNGPVAPAAKTEFAAFLREAYQGHLDPEALLRKMEERGRAA